MRALHSKLMALLHSGFVRSVGVLVGGAVLGQAIMILVLPIVTRLYSPADFSMFAVYASLLGIVSTVACLRVEIAIPMAESDEDAYDLLALALLLTSAVAVTTALAVWLAAKDLAIVVGHPDLESYLWLLPLGVWLSGLYSALQYMATRNKQFSAIAATRIGQAIGGGGTQVVLGWLGLVPIGLLLGHIVYRAAGMVRLAMMAMPTSDSVARLLQPRRLTATLRRYQRFPKYSTPEALANIGAIELPVLMIAAIATGPEAGFLMLAMRVMQAPMSLVGSAVSQVFLSRAVKEEKHQGLAHLTMRVVSGLARVGAGPIIFVGILAPRLFPIVFGTPWERAGEIVSWMTPWFVMQFLASPVSMALHVTWSQRAAMALHISGLLLRVGVVAIVMQINPDRGAEAYAVSGFVFYSIFLMVIVQTVGASPGMLFRAITSSILPAVVWTASAVAVWVGVEALSRVSAV